MKCEMDFYKNKEDLIEARAEISMKLQARSKRHFWDKVIGVVVMAMGFIEIASSYAMAAPVYMLAGVLLVLFGSVYIYRSSAAFRKSQLIREMKGAGLARFTGVHKFTIDEEGIRESSSHGNSRMSWDTVESWGTSGHYIYAAGEEDRLFLFDTNQLTAEKRVELEEMLRENVQGE